MYPVRTLPIPAWFYRLYGRMLFFLRRPSKKHRLLFAGILSVPCFGQPNLLIRSPSRGKRTLGSGISICLNLFYQIYHICSMSYESFFYLHEMSYKNETPEVLPQGFCFSRSRHLPIFTGRVQPTIFGTSELNFCVRNGNRWDLTVIDTGRLD